MNRYDENVSPQPSELTSLESNCNFKTPDTSNNVIQLTNSLSASNELLLSSSAFPTPPSDNDETTRDSVASYHKYQVNFLKNTHHTPIIEQHYQHYYDRQQTNLSQLISNSSNQSFDQTSLNDYNSSDTNDVDLLSINADKVAEAALSSSRFKRRSRTTFSKHQLDILEATFQKTHYPDIAVVDRLSQVLNLGTERISIWFQNRRARHKKERKLQVEQAKALQKQQHQLAANQHVSSTEQWKAATSTNNMNKLTIDRLTSITPPSSAPQTPQSYNINESINSSYQGISPTFSHQSSSKTNESFNYIPQLSINNNSPSTNYNYGNFHFLNQSFDNRYYGQTSFTTPAYQPNYIVSPMYNTNQYQVNQVS